MCTLQNIQDNSNKLKYYTNYAHNTNMWVKNLRQQKDHHYQLEWKRGAGTGNKVKFFQKCVA